MAAIRFPRQPPKQTLCKIFSFLFVSLKKLTLVCEEAFAHGKRQTSQCTKIYIFCSKNMGGNLQENTQFCACVGNILTVL
jgi:hypothetical protein